MNERLLIAPIHCRCNHSEGAIAPGGGPQKTKKCRRLLTAGFKPEGKLSALMQIDDYRSSSSLSDLFCRDHPYRGDCPHDWRLQLISCRFVSRRDPPTFPCQDHSC